jgi:cardiolipin synthase
VTVRSGHTICVALAQLTGAPITTGNQLCLLRDGGMYFPALLTAVSGARRSVSLQMYRFHGGVIATRFAQALAKRARAGVQVRALIDDYGTGGMDRGLAGLLATSGVDLRIYNSLRITNLWRLHRRNHRKLIAIDGREAFVSGMNLDDVFAGSDTKRAWRENAVCVRGPLALEIDASIRAAWSGRDQLREASPPSVSEAAALIGSSDAQLLLSDHQHPTLRTAYLYVIRTALRSIYVSSAYFVPQPDLAGALMSAAKRGVDVRVLTTGVHNNIALARVGSHATYRPLLRSGVRIFEYRPTMLHAKSIIADGKWCALGSANLDACGFRFNLESQIATCNETFVEELQQSYLADTEDADEITFDAWTRRPFSKRVADVVLRPLRHVL